MHLLGVTAATVGLGLILPAWAADPPDLAPIDFQAPTVVTGSLRPSVTLVWGVTNYGPGTAVGAWYDSVSFSPNGVDWEEISVNGETGPIAAGGSYWRTNTVRVPVLESGAYYLMFKTDTEDSLHEADTNNNASAAVPISFTILAPDLVPVALQVPNPITGPPHPFVTLVWGVTNQGVGPAAAPWGWTDRVHSSTDPVLDEGDYLSGSFHQDGPLAVGGCYWVSNTVRVAAPQSGTYYLILETDWGNDLHESDPNNNLLVVPVSITVLPPDLTPISFQVPERVTGPPNPTVTLVWGVTNQGIGPAEGSLGDRVYLSTEPVVNPANETVVCWNVVNGPLAAGGSYWRTNTVRIPVTESGTYYLILETDADDVLGDSDRSNDMLAVPIEFEILPPDLTPLALHVPTVITGAPNSTVSVVWGVTNQGTGEALATGTWTDRFCFSAIDFLDPTAVVVATGSETGPVPAGGAYWRTTNMRLPAVEAGTYYFIFAANADAALYESDTNNNQMVVPVTLVPERSDLKPVVVDIPAHITGPPRMTVTLVWGVTNQSAAPAIPSKPWSDNVYFCSSPVQDGTDSWLSEVRQAGPLAPGGTYWYTNTVRIPVSRPSGTYYFIFKTDAFNSVSESDEANNVIAVQVSVDVRPPDLVPIALQVPSAIVGPPNPVVTLAWGVTNRGTGPAIDWSDRVYLSTNAVWDAGDTEIVRSVEAGPVEPGQTYWRTNIVRIPVLQSGTYHLIFKADASESLYESGEDNNVLVVPVTFDVRPPDLVPIALQVPSLIAGPPNPSVTVVWGVTNRGVGPAIDWSDRLFVSTNTVWDAGDREISRGIELGPVEFGEAYWRTNMVRMPVVVSGTYYLILKADADASLYELDEGNNTLAVPMAFEVRPPDLVPLVLQAPTVLTGPPDPGAEVTLVWGVTNQGVGPAVGNPTWRNRVYLSHRPVLDEDDDEVVDWSDTALVEAGGCSWHTNTVALDVFRSGSYYLFFKADADNSLYESNETNNVTVVPVTINVLFPARFSDEDEEDEKPEFLPDGSFVLCVYGALGASYRLEASTNLTDWAHIVGFTCTNSPTEVADRQAKDHAWRFYRAVALTNAAGF
jgi:subtilase family serine protease